MVRKHVMGAFGLILSGAFCTTLMLLGVPSDMRIADAARKGNRTEIESLIRQAVDVNSAEGDGMTALHWAALNGDADMARMLISAGANVRAATRLGGYTPLFMASERGRASVIDVLLKAGADPKATAMGGFTPLMSAAMSGSQESIRLLLDRGADPNARESEHEQSPLSFAASFNRPDAIEVLLKHGANPNVATKTLPPAASRPNPEAPPPAAPAPAAPGGTSPAKAAADKEKPAAVQFEGGEKGGRNPRGRLTPLMFAAREGGAEAVRKLLDGGADINARGADYSTALLLATINGHLDLAEYLVSRNADVNIRSLDGMTPLYGVVNIQWARKSFYPQPTTKYEKISYLDLMRYMLDHGADPNTRLTNDIWYSAYNFNLESASSIGTTAFWKCAEVGDLDGMRLLVSRGADPNLTSKDGVTPLLMASGAGVHGNDDITTPHGRLAG